MSRKRRWDDSESDDHGLPDRDAASPEKPAKRTFIRGLVGALYQPFRWAVRHLFKPSAASNGVANGSRGDTPTLENGMALRQATIGVAMTNPDGDGQARQNSPGQRSRWQQKSRHGQGHGEGRRHQAPAAGTGLAMAMSSPNASHIPPFHFSPSPVGRGAAYSSLLTTGGNEPRRPSSMATTGMASHGLASVQREVRNSVSSPILTKAASTSLPSKKHTTAAMPPPSAAAVATAMDRLQRTVKSPAAAPAAVSPPPAPAAVVGGNHHSRANGESSSAPHAVVFRGANRAQVSSLAKRDIGAAAKTGRGRRRPSYLSCESVRLRERDCYRRMLNRLSRHAQPARHAQPSSANGDARSADTGADVLGTGDYLSDEDVGLARHPSAQRSAPQPEHSIFQHRVDDGSYGHDDAFDDDDVIITSETAGHSGTSGGIGLPASSSPPQQQQQRIISSPYGFFPAYSGALAAEAAAVGAATAPVSAYDRRSFAELNGQTHAGTHRSPADDWQHRQHRQQVMRAGRERNQLNLPVAVGTALSSSFGASFLQSAAAVTMAAARSYSRPPPPGSIAAYTVRQAGDRQVLSPREESHSPDERQPNDEADVLEDMPSKAPVMPPSQPRPKMSSRPRAKDASSNWLQDLCSKHERSVISSRQKNEALSTQLQRLTLPREEAKVAAQQKLKELVSDLRQRSRAMPLIDSPFLDEESEEEEEAVLPELSEEQDAMVDSALRPGRSSAVLASAFNTDITRADVATLSGSGWLNDEVINFFFQLIKAWSDAAEELPTIHVMSSFFYPKLISTGYASIRRWTRKVDIFSKDLIAVPIHLGMHWCLAMIDFRQKSVIYYDSLLGDNSKCLNALATYIQQESVDKKKVEYDVSEWTLEHAKDVPEQLNGCDCGVFACTYAAYLAREEPFTFTQDDMPYFRRRMVYEILTQKSVA